MTAKQAQDALNRKFPLLIVENLPLWLVIMNLMEQIGNEKGIRVAESKINEPLKIKK